jgi:hypothetical protein
LLRFPIPSIENFSEAAANSARIDRRLSERNPGAGWAHQVPDDNPQNEAGAGDGDEGDDQNQRNHGMLVESAGAVRVSPGVKTELDLFTGDPRERQRGNLVFGSELDPDCFHIRPCLATLQAAENE